MAVVVLGLAAYGFDCEARTTPPTGDAVLQFNAVLIAWSSRDGLLQDHAKDAAPFVQLSSGHDLSVSPVVAAIKSASVELRSLHFSAPTIAAQCNAPPGPCAASPLNLRV
jgi:hypothetical protein